jgi:hypothetical protein
LVEAARHSQGIDDHLSKRVNTVCRPSAEEALMKYCKLAVLLVAVAIPLLAQSGSRPPAERKEQIREHDGRTQTYVFSTETNQVLRTEDDESVNVYLYDTAGRQTGMTVRPRNASDLALTVNVSQAGQLSVDGMPSIDRLTNADGRQLSIATDQGTPIASYRYGENGALAEMKLGNRLALRLTPAGKAVREVLVNANGEVIHETVVNGQEGTIPTALALDVVRHDLGLGVDWPAQIRFHKSASNQLMTVSDTSGHVLLYIVLIGEDRVGFSAKGNPLFYDLAVSLEKNVADGSGTDTGPDASADFAAIAPNRVVLTHAGLLEAYVSRASSGAIVSFWTEKDSAGTSTSRYRKACKASSSSMNTTTSDNAVPIAARRLRPRTDTLVRNQTTICTSYDGGNEVCTVEVTYEWIEDGPGAGGGGSGGGGNAGGGNNVNGDTALRFAVTNATTKARAKLALTQCAALLGKTGKDGSTLLSTMNARGFTDPAAYFGTHLSFVNGGSAGLCSPGSSANAAHTLVYASKVNVCKALANYGASQAANLLIHEMLHSLGLTEKPGYPDAAMNSDQITQAVTAACGS